MCYILLRIQKENFKMNKKQLISKMDTIKRTIKIFEAQLKQKHSESVESMLSTQKSKLNALRTQYEQTLN